MTLRDKLKQIYTGGNSYTVLQLLHELIDTIDEFDTGLPLYKHTISFNEGEQTIELVTTIPYKATSIRDLNELLTSAVSAKCNSYTILNYALTSEYLRVRYFEGIELSYSDVTDFTDTVTLME